MRSPEIKGHIPVLTRTEYNFIKNFHDWSDRSTLSLIEEKGIFPSDDPKATAQVMIDGKLEVISTWKNDFGTLSVILTEGESQTEPVVPLAIVKGEVKTN
jgi:hypothetical protein